MDFLAKKNPGDSWTAESSSTWITQSFYILIFVRLSAVLYIDESLDKVNCQTAVSTDVGLSFFQYFYSLVFLLRVTTLQWSLYV